MGVGIGFALSTLLSSKDEEITRLRADADDLKQRVEKLGRRALGRQHRPFIKES